MERPPAEVLEAVIDAVARDDAPALLGLLDRVDLERLYRQRLLIVQTARHAAQQDPRAAEMYEQVLAELQIGSAEELETATREETVRQLLRRLPREWRRLRCLVVGTVLEGKTVAHVVFRLQGPGIASTDEQVHVATVRKSSDGWRLVVPHGSHWILPGFENLVVFSEQAG